MKKSNVGSMVFNIVNVTLFLIFTLICVFPFYYIFINSISDNSLAAKGAILLYPKGIHFENYVEVFKLKSIGSAAAVSVARTVLGTLLTLLGSSFLGYAFAKKEYWKRKFWYRYVVVTMYFSAGIIPWFVTMKGIGLYNSFLAYILPTVVSPFYVILFKTYIEQIPPSLEESVQLDGGGYAVRYFKIILPLSMPILATIAVFSCSAQWNAFLDTLLLVRDQELYTLQFILYQYLSETEALAAQMRSSQGTVGSAAANYVLTATSVRMTVTFVIILPILFVYPFFQRYFVSGIMIGAIKG